MVAFALCLRFCIRLALFVVCLAAAPVASSISISVNDAVRLGLSVQSSYIIPIPSWCFVGCAAVSPSNIFSSSMSQRASQPSLHSSRLDLIIPPSAIFVSISAVSRGLEASSRSFVDNRSFLAISAGPNTLVRSLVLFALFLLERSPFAIFSPNVRSHSVSPDCLLCLVD